MILDAMTYAAMTVVAVLSFVVILLAWNPLGQRNDGSR